MYPCTLLGPQEGAEQAPRKKGVPLRPWHRALPSLGLHPSLWPPSPSLHHPSNHPKCWPSPQGSGQPPGLTMAQTTSWSTGKPCQISVPGRDSYRKCTNAAVVLLKKMKKLRYYLICELPSLLRWSWVISNFMQTSFKCLTSICLTVKV